MIYRNSAIAIAVTLVLVIAAMGIAFFAVAGLSLMDRFTIDRFLSIVGALGAFGWIVGVGINFLRYWLRSTNSDS